MTSARIPTTLLPSFGRGAFVRAVASRLPVACDPLFATLAPSPYWAFENENDQVHPGEVDA